MRIFIFGDSITQGFYDPQGGWVQHLQNVLHAKSLDNLTSGKDEYYEVFNLGVSGDTAVGIVGRIKNEIESRRLYDVETQDIVLLSVGINDAILQNNRVVTDAYDFQESYEKAINLAKNLNTRVVCIGLTAVDEAQTDPWFGSSSGKQWKNNRINLFEDTIKQSAERTNVEFIHIHDEFLAKLRSGTELLADGLHPNHAGHQFIFKKVAELFANDTNNLTP